MQDPTIPKLQGPGVFPSPSKELCVKSIHLISPSQTHSSFYLNFQLEKSGKVEDNGEGDDKDKQCPTFAGFHNLKYCQLPILKVSEMLEANFIRLANKYVLTCDLINTGNEGGSSLNCDSHGCVDASCVSRVNQRNHDWNTS